MIKSRLTRSLAAALLTTTVMAITVPVSAQAATPEPAAEQASMSPDRVAPPAPGVSTQDAYGQAAIGGILSGCFLQHYIGGSGTNIFVDRARARCPGVSSRPLVNPGFVFDYYEGNSSYPNYYNRVRAGYRSGTYNDTGEVDRRNPAVRRGTACVTLELNGQRAAYQCHGIG